MVCLLVHARRATRWWQIIFHTNYFIAHWKCYWWRNSLKPPFWNQTRWVLKALRLFFSSRPFFTLGEHGLETFTVFWQSALNSTFFSVPDRLLVLVAASHGPQGPNLYLQSSERDNRWSQVSIWSRTRWEIQRNIVEQEAVVRSGNIEGVLVVGGCARATLQHCRGTPEQGIKSPNTHIGAQKTKRKTFPNVEKQQENNLSIFAKLH